MRIFNCRAAVAALLMVCFSGSAWAQAIGYLPHYTGNQVVVYDADTNSVVTTITGFTRPLGVGVRPDGSQAYITQYTSTGAVQVIDTATNTIAATIPVARYPWTAVFSHDGSKAYVSHAYDEITVIDTATQSVTGTIAGTGHTHGLALSADGTKLYGAGYDYSQIYVIDTATNSVTDSFPSPFPTDVEVSPDGATLYVFDRGLQQLRALDAASGSTLASVAVPGLYSIAMSADGATVYVPGFIFSPGNVSVVDTASMSVTSTIAVGGYPVGIGITPDQTRILVTGSPGGETNLIDAGTLAVTAGPVISGNLLVMGNPFTPGVVKNDPQVKNDCKKDGWKQYGFKNQGQCVRFVNTDKDSRA